MFIYYKSGCYNIESTGVTVERLIALIILINEGLHLFNYIRR